MKSQRSIVRKSPPLPEVAVPGQLTVSDVYLFIAPTQNVSGVVLGGEREVNYGHASLLIPGKMGEVPLYISFYPSFDGRTLEGDFRNPSIRGDAMEIKMQSGRAQVYQLRRLNIPEIRAAAIELKNRKPQYHFQRQNCATLVENLLRRGGMRTSWFTWFCSWFFMLTPHILERRAISAGAVRIEAGSVLAEIKLGLSRAVTPATDAGKIPSNPMYAAAHPSVSAPISIAAASVPLAVEAVPSTLGFDPTQMSLKSDSKVESTPATDNSSLVQDWDR